MARGHSSTRGRPGREVEFKRNKEAGKYAACRLKAEAKAVKKGIPPDYTKCDEKLAKKWAKIENKADGACPSSGDESEVKQRLDETIADVSTLLGGGDPSPLFLFAPSQTIDGVLVECDAAEHTADYTACLGIVTHIDGGTQVGMRNGILCTDDWRSQDPPGWDPAGLCMSLTGSNEFEIKLDAQCSPSQPRGLWNAGVWTVTSDNGIVTGLRCYFPGSVAP